MTVRALLIISLALNVVLAGVLLLRNQPPSQRGEAADSRVEAPAGKVAFASRTSLIIPASAASPALDWRNVEAPDYRQYIANLRAIGCPEETIKDIVIADVVKSYAARGRELRRGKRAFRYWETEERRLMPEKKQEGFRRAQDNLYQEQGAILHELLGINLEVELRRYLVDSLLGEDEELSFLDEDKRSRLFGLRAEFEWRRAQAEERSKDDTAGKTAREELQKIDAEEQAALAQLLTPAEMQEYELATSNLAVHLRARLVGFNPTPEEFQKVYQLHKEASLRSVWLGSANSPAKGEEKADLERFQAEMRRSLGEARYADYQRSGDDEYNNLARFCAQQELPSSLAMSAFEIKQAAEQKKQNLQASPALLPEQRQEAIRALAAETRLALQQTLGSNAFTRYDQLHGGWIQVLGSKPKGTAE